MKLAPFFSTINIASKILMIPCNLLCTGSMAGASVNFQQREELQLNKDMEYIQFLKDVQERVEARFGGKVKGEVCTSRKNNGVTVTGLMLKGEEERVAPNFYLDRQFVEWMRGLCTLEDVAEKICHAYQEEIDKNSQLLTKIQFTWEEFRRGVFLRLVNKEKNAALLETIPHREFLDLALVYYYSVPISDEVVGTLVITKEHLEILQISEEVLHQTAISNCDRFQPVKIRCMEDLLYDLGRKVGVEVHGAKNCHPYLFVMTNSKGSFGAAALVFEEELECFSKRINSSFYVLPSSVHEVILVPACPDFSVDYFRSMVKEINETQVDATEVLSDNIYFYDKETKQLCIC